MVDPMREAIREIVREVVREEIAAAIAKPADDLVPHTKWPCSSRRRAAELARRGVIAAVRRGRLWWATRAALDAYTASPKAPPVPQEESFEELAAEARRRRRRAA